MSHDATVNIENVSQILMESKLLVKYLLKLPLYFDVFLKNIY